MNPEMLDSLIQAGQVEVTVTPATSVNGNRMYTCTARTGEPNVLGSACSEVVEDTRCRAVMEWAERFAQFGPMTVTPTCIDSLHELDGSSISPLTCGLYSQAQYAMFETDIGPFDETEPLEWVTLKNILDGQERLLPIEFIYPRLPLGRPRIVAETSSGVAANTDLGAATLAALCEIVERDCMMTFWYRQPPTPVISSAAIADSRLRSRVQQAQALGFVVVIFRISYDLSIPCFLVVAVRGSSFAYGAGCHPDSHAALAHAVQEFWSRLTWLTESPQRNVLHAPLLQVRAPSDHYMLFNQGPLHGVLRAVLERVSSPSSDQVAGGEQAPAPVKDSLDLALAALEAKGYSAYARDIAPDFLQEHGVHVVRAVVPGLIPIHFGYHRIRLGCERLTSLATPGRLRTLLPHFVD